MKSSLKFRASDADQPPHILLRAKLPVSILGFPFSALASAGSHPSDLSFRLSTSSPAGPSLSLAYHPSANPSSCSLTLKSGVGLLGSPVDSPLVLSARLTIPQPGRPTSGPAFFLHLRPRFGHFSLKRTLLSASSPNPSVLTSDAGGQVGILSGISAVTQTEIPVARLAAVRFRWGVNFPPELDKGLPFLTFDKISIERVEDAGRPATEAAARSSDNYPAKNGNLEGYKRELEGLRRENESMKASIMELRLEAREGPAKKAGEAGEFEKWRSRRRRANGEVELKKADEVEEELKRAIKSAAS